MLDEDVSEFFWEGVVDSREDGEEVVIERAHVAFSGVTPMYVRGYELLSDLPVLLNGMLMFSADFVIKNL